VSSYRDIARDQLRVDEGVKNKPYRDTAGKLTIGVGHNLDDDGLSPKAIAFLLEEDIDAAEYDARALFPNFDDLSDNRKAVLINMAFNLGPEGLSLFRKFRRAVTALDFDTAYVELVSSLWADQVGVRATRLAKQMKDG
jgi:lysozyme